MKAFFSLIFVVTLSGTYAQRTVAAADTLQQQIDEEVIIHLLEKTGQIDAKRTSSGLYYFVQEPGAGAAPQSGDRVRVRYEGRLPDGKVFDHTKNNSSFRFNVGIGEVIPGWDEGVLLMKEGEKATLYIPSHLAYGTRGAGKVIPPNTVLIFDIELISFN